MISTEEAKNIVVSTLAIALALSIASEGLGILSQPGKLVYLISLFAITVGIGFVLHELAHKVVAIRFGGQAEFRMWIQGLVLALLFSVFGFVFVSPGAVYIYAPKVTKQQNGLISLAGPLTNMALSLVFLAIAAVFPMNMALPLGYGSVWLFASKINVWLGLFNMIPIFPLDGSKVFDWNVAVWAAFSLLFVFLFIY